MKVQTLFGVEMLVFKHLILASRPYKQPFIFRPILVPQFGRGFRALLPEREIRMKVKEFGIK